MEIGVQDLAEIFEDPLLNDLTDNLLNDIDFHEFENFPIDCEEQLAKCSSKNDNCWGKSNHATLEALLKSQPPRTCVPPAPDLNSGVGLTTKIDTASDTHPDYNHWDLNNQGRSSHPIPIPQYSLQNGKPKMEMSRVSPKSRLICDYLGKCSNESSSRFILRPAAEYHPRPVHAAIPDVAQTESSDWDRNSSQKRLPQMSNGFRVQNSTVCVSNSGTDDCDASGSSADRPVRRAPHNAIEKRYRASINGRIDELRKILIPFPSADTKLNKSAVLRQAIERIKELEARNERLHAEVMSLRRLHAGHVSKSYNSSPESGISLDPSPTSNYTGPEFGQITPPSMTDSYGSMYNLNGVLNGGAPSNSSSAELPNSCLATDTCATTPWSLTMSSPEKPDSVFFSTTAPLESQMDDCALFDRGGPIYSSTTEDETAPIPPDIINQYAIHGDSLDQAYQQPLGQMPTQSNFASVARTTGNRGKRVACTMESGPLKVRCQLAPGPIPNGQFVSGTPVQVVKCLPPDGFRATTTESQLPNVHGLLLNQQQQQQQQQQQPTPVDPGQPVGSIARKLANYAVPAGGFNDLAARTTLCVSALCLVALDPAALTTTSESSGQRSVGTARRLLTISSLFTSPFATWINCLLYMLQWIVALTLCFWAWRRGTVRGSFQPPAGTRFSARTDAKYLSARSHWIKANAAMDEGAAALSERHLNECLDDLDASLPRVPAHNQYFRRAWAWCSVSWGATRLLCMHVPYRGFKSLVCKVTALLISRRPTCIVRDAGPTPSVPMVRSRLLELYLLEHYKDATAVTLHVDKLSFARLFLTCCRDFMDAPVVPEPCTDCTEPVERTRQGLVLVLVASQIARSTWLSRLLMRWVTADFQMNPDSKTHNSTWSYLATSPCFAAVLTGCKDITLPPVASGSTVLYRFPDRLRSALNRELSAQCLQVILYGTNRELDNLGPTIEALLHLFPPTATGTPSDSYDFDEGCSVEQTNSNTRTVSCAYAFECCRWWAHLLHTVWFQRISRSQKHLIKVIGFTDARLNKPLHKALFSCPTSGPLVQALWLLYGNAPNDCSVEAAKQACHLLRKSMRHLSAIGSDEKRTTNLFSFDLFHMMAWHWLALDRALTVLIGSLLNTTDTPRSDDSHTVDTTATTILSLTLVVSMLRQLANSSTSPAPFTPPRWIGKKISYAETVYRIAIGANPVRTRLALLQYNQIVRSRSAAEQADNRKVCPHSLEPIVHSPSVVSNRITGLDDLHQDDKESSDMTQQKLLTGYFDRRYTTASKPSPHGIADREPGLSRYNTVTQSPGQ